MSYGRCSLLLLLQFLEVELELPAFNDVAINATGLAWAGRNASEDASRVELISKLGVNLTVLLTGLECALDGVASLHALASFIRFFKLLLVELNVVLLEVPLSEGSGIDAHNGVLNESLRSDKLVVGGVVDSVENSSLGGHGLGTPREVAGVVAESAALDVSTAATDVDALFGTKLGHSRDSSHFELSLFLVDWHTATRSSPLMSGVPRNTHTS